MTEDEFWEWVENSPADVGRELWAATQAMPETYYADLPLPTRIQMMVRSWWKTT